MKVAVLGGGISGLSAARYLAQEPQLEVSLFEKQSYLGGWIQSERQNGFLFEKGPRTFSSSRSPELLSLISELQLEQDLLFSSLQANKRYLWRKGKLRSFWSQIFPQWWRFLAEIWIPPSEDEETIYEFAKRRFGKKLANMLFDPLTTGIFGGNARELSVASCFPQFVKWEKTYGSLVRGALFSPQQKKMQSPLFTLRNGMKQLIDALSRQSGRTYLNCSIDAVTYHQAKWWIETSQGPHQADAVFCALPAYEVKRLFPSMPFISYKSLSVVNLGISSSFPYQGYGYLVPSEERNSLLGMVWDSEIFPTQGEKGVTRVTAMISPHEDAEQIALKALRDLKIFTLPSACVLTQANQAIPQFSLGHRERIKEWEKNFSCSFPSLYFLGNYFEGVSVEHCIARSKSLTTQFQSVWKN